eukprot:CAMPEP_0113329360 /NCGR_PEP_ID=MMETSP0010_2-20120614/20842_1 /TAXON_ID=216773 ORGANISM="Corethron hystrix, Strain 308" /NCGR_SAMPLE_ID=MMETSP0010_2 /ASSEMBLY_ACC=CAM_ASM_000155 /LENGTH=50 /DNA_ID=CAMNT_0000191411 /DNA_START=26 /DNA_END=175 /DNA_ORIENTATION=- /assembly_acc=CAM_ASM_000155
MKLFLSAAFIASASAFAPTAFTGRTSVARDASIADTIAELQGPEIFWGSE